MFVVHSVNFSHFKLPRCNYYSTVRTVFSKTWYKLPLSSLFKWRAIFSAMNSHLTKHYKKNLFLENYAAYYNIHFLNQTVLHSTPFASDKTWNITKLPLHTAFKFVQVKGRVPYLYWVFNFVISYRGSLRTDTMYNISETPSELLIISF